MKADKAVEKKEYELKVQSLDHLMAYMKKYAATHEQVALFLEESFNEKVELLKQRHGLTSDYVRLKNQYHFYKGIEGS